MADAVKTTKEGTGADIKKCSCINQYQDIQYGIGMRVHNRTAKGAKCTVCGDIKR